MCTLNICIYSTSIVLYTYTEYATYACYVINTFCKYCKVVNGYSFFYSNQTINTRWHLRLEIQFRAVISSTLHLLNSLSEHPRRRECTKIDSNISKVKIMINK